MEAIFPMQTYDSNDEEKIYFCNKVMEFLKERLPMNFRKWFIIRNYQYITSSITQSYPETGIEPNLLLKEDTFITINLFCFDNIIVPVPNPNKDYDNYHSITEPNYLTHEEIEDTFPYMFDEYGEVPLYIRLTHQLYICTHEWMHTLTYIDWNLADRDSEYLWFVEYQVDVKVLNFIKTYYDDIVRCLNFKPHIQYLEDLFASMHEHIIAKLPKFIGN